MSLEKLRNINKIGFVADKLPVVKPIAEQNPSLWLNEKKELVRQIIRDYGGVLLRGFDVESLSQFNRFALTFSPELLEYTNKSTPRTNLGGRIYTSTEYPADKRIPLHNENSYSSVWGEFVIFFCAVEPGEGGETPLADASKVLGRIDDCIVKKFAEKGVMYVRNYIEGIDLSWHEVFQTDNKNVLKQICSKAGIKHEWVTNDWLRTKEVRQAVYQHPLTKNKVWFNQAHLFHISSQGEDAEKVMIEEFGVEQLPRNAFYGDGSAISKETLENIREAINRETYKFAWQRGDILIIDNVLTMHGRMPYRGSRKIAVAIA